MVTPKWGDNLADKPVKVEAEGYSIPRQAVDEIELDETQTVVGARVRRSIGLESVVGETVQGSSLLRNRLGRTHAEAYLDVAQRAANLQLGVFYIAMDSRGRIRRGTGTGLRRWRRGVRVGGIL